MIKKRKNETVAAELNQITYEIVQCKRLINSSHIQGMNELGKQDLALARAAIDRALEWIIDLDDDD